MILFLMLVFIYLVRFNLKRWISVSGLSKM